MAFTTWANLLTEMKNDLASGQWKYKSYSINNRSVTYSTVDEFMTVFKFVEERAGLESGAFVPRTYAKNGGRA